MRSRWKSPVIKAYRYGDGFSAEAANAFPAAMILVDAYQKGAAGGTGTVLRLAAGTARGRSRQEAVLIAGGISEANVAEVNDIFHPFAVDVSGSLEVNREKSASRIAAFMEQVHEINRRN